MKKTSNKRFKQNELWSILSLAAKYANFQTKCVFGTIFSLHQEGGEGVPFELLLFAALPAGVHKKPIGKR